MYAYMILFLSIAKFSLGKHHLLKEANSYGKVALPSNIFHHVLCAVKPLFTALSITLKKSKHLAKLPCMLEGIFQRLLPVQ